MDWIVTCLTFETAPDGSSRARRRELVMRIPGSATSEEVTEIVERLYAERYQPGWDGARSTIEERAGPGLEEGHIEVGQEPRFVARRIREDS